MKLKKLKLQELKNLYESELTQAFPPEELKPYTAMERLFLENRYHVFGAVQEDGLMVGFAFLWGEKDNPYILLDYLGVTQSRRNSGLGAKILALLAEEYRNKNGILAEVEIPDGREEDALRRRRLNFYLRNGYRLLEYDCDLFGVHFKTLMQSPDGKGTEAAALQAHKKLYQAHLSPEHYRRYIEIPRDVNAPNRPLVSWMDLDAIF